MPGYKPALALLGVSYKYSPGTTSNAINVADNNPKTITTELFSERIEKLSEQIQQLAKQQTD
ncbi:MAG: hypothetical protein ACFB14_08915 [Leptolyngbyaceae cyanobacterium]